MSKSPFKQSKTIYIFPSGRVIVTVQIHSRKKDFKQVEMTTAKWTWIRERSRIYAIVVQDSMKRGVCRCGVVEMPLGPLTFPRLADQALQQFCPWMGPFLKCRPTLS
jgi:hypothetical protein